MSRFILLTVIFAAVCGAAFKTVFAFAYATAPNYGNMMEFECPNPSAECSVWVSYNIAYQYSGDNNPKLLEDKMYTLKLKEQPSVTASFYVKNGLVYDFKHSDGVGFKGARVFEEIYIETVKKQHPHVPRGDMADSMGEISSGIEVEKVNVAPVLFFEITGESPLRRVFIVSSGLGFIMEADAEGERYFRAIPDGHYVAELLYSGLQYGRPFYARSGRFANFDVKGSHIKRFFSDDGVRVVEAPDDEMVLLMNSSLKDVENGVKTTF